MRDADERTIVAFLTSIGVPVEIGAIEEATFVPGILIDRGRLRVDFRLGVERILFSRSP